LLNVAECSLNGALQVWASLRARGGLSLREEEMAIREGAVHVQRLQRIPRALTPHLTEALAMDAKSSW
jgi:hypothetical protein